MSTQITKRFENEDTGDVLINVSQDNVAFENINTGTLGLMGTISIKNSITNGGTEQSPIVNAIDIDWNNAKLGQIIIATTGQLLSYLSAISEKVNAIENALLNL